MTSSYLRSLPDHPGVAGILVHARQDLLFTSDRDAARVSVYRCSDEQPLARIEVGAHPYGPAYDPARRRLLAFNLGEPPGHNCTASVIDLDSSRVVSTIALPGRPRWAAYDAASGRVFANIRQPAQILAIDAGRLRIDRAVSVPAQGPHGLWIDRQRLFCAADSGSLVVIDRDTATAQATLPLPGAPDVVMHDAGLAHLYVAVGQPGVICVVDTQRLKLLQTVPTQDGAHTIAADPESHTVYAFLPGSGGAAVYADR